MKNANDSAVAKLYGATSCEILEGPERGFIPGELGIQLKKDEVIELLDEVFLIKTPRLTSGMKAISIKGSEQKLPMGTLLKRNAKRELHPDTAKMLEASKAKDADSLIKFLVGKKIVVTAVEEIDVQKFVDNAPDGENTVKSRRYGFALKA